MEGKLGVGKVPKPVEQGDGGTFLSFFAIAGEKNGGQLHLTL